MNNKLKKALKSLVGVGIAALLIWLSFRSVDFKAFAQGLKSCRWSWVLFSLVAGLMALIIRGLRWTHIIRPLDPDVRFWSVFSSYNVGNLFSFAVPGSGEFVRAGLAKTPKAGYDRIFGTIAAERIADALSILILTTAAIVLGEDSTGAFFRHNIIEPLSSRVGGGWVLILLVLAIVSLVVLAVIRLRGKVALFDKVCRVFRGIADGAVAVLKMNGKGVFLLYTAGLWFCYWLEVFGVSRALPEINIVSPADILFISMVGSFASVIPAPGGMGAYHYLNALAISTVFGATWNQGILFATIAHEPHNLMVILVGVVSLVLRRLSNRER